MFTRAKLADAECSQLSFLIQVTRLERLRTSKGMESSKQTKGHIIPGDILDELAVRFILNMPQQEKNDMMRVMFKVEEAHWFYIDFYVMGEPERKLASGTMREFAEHMFRHVPPLQPHADKVDEIMQTWREYKIAVPTFGAIILNPDLDKVLLVQGFSAKASWGFPKGKVNQEEPGDECAAREVMEEIGYDITPKLDSEEYLEQIINDKPVRLYVIHGVEETTKFQTNTRCEIRDIKWFPLDSLPTSKTDQSCKLKLGVAPNNFFMVIPFLRDIKAWVRLASKDRAPSVPSSQKKKGKKDPRREEGEARPQATPILQPPLLGLEEEEQGDRARVAAQAVARDIKRPVAKRPGEKRQSVEKESPAKTEVRSRKKSISSSEKDGIIPHAFIPKAWASFKLEHDALLAIALGRAKPGL